MQPHDSPRFFKSLAEMGLMFCDEVSRERQKLYWEAFLDTVSIDEWEHACMQAIRRETFHKLPLPAQLMDYVQEYRRAEREARLQQQCALGVQSRSRLLELRDSLVDPAEIDALIASVWPEEHTTPPYPRLPDRRRLTQEELAYEPTIDAETAKQKARAQLRQLLDEERGFTHE